MAALLSTMLGLLVLAASGDGGAYENSSAEGATLRSMQCAASWGMENLRDLREQGTCCSAGWPSEPRTTTTNPGIAASRDGTESSLRGLGIIEGGYWNDTSTGRQGSEAE